MSQVDEHAALADASEGDQLTVGETGGDLARLGEVGMRPGHVAGLEEPHHRQSVFEVALLDTVDARLFQEASGAIDPPPAPGQVALEPDPLGDLPPEIRRPVQRALIDADLVGSDPMGEALLVVAGQLGRSGEAVEVVDAERVDVDVGQQPPRVPPSVAFAGRLCVLDGSHHGAQSRPTRGRSGEERIGGVREGAQEHPHLGDAITVEPVHERVARLEGLVVPLPDQGGVLPLGRPAVGTEAELLVEGDLAVGGLEVPTEDAEQPPRPA